MILVAIYYICFVLSIVGVILTFKTDGVEQTIIGGITNLCCLIVLSFRALYARGVHFALKHKVRVFSKWIYLGANPFQASITIVTSLLLLANIIYLCISYPKPFNFVTQIGSLFFSVYLFYLIITKHG